MDSLLSVLCSIHIITICLQSSKHLQHSNSIGLRRYRIYEFKVFKSISIGQMDWCNGLTLTESDCFSHVFLLVNVMATVSSSSSNDVPSKYKNFCSRVAHCF